MITYFFYVVISKVIGFWIILVQVAKNSFWESNYDSLCSEFLICEIYLLYYSWLRYEVLKTYFGYYLLSGLPEVGYIYYGNAMGNFYYNTSA